MPYVTVGRENSAAIRIYYEDHGSGSPVVLVHGYALNGHSWEKQEAALLAAGHRVITYDRRGGGASSRPSTGYDFGTLATDLHLLLSRLDLHGAVLAGFAMGTGEVARHLAEHGSERVRAAVLIAPLLPFLLKTSDNPDGIDRSVLDDIAARIAADRPAAMKDFMDRSYNVDLLDGSRVSDQAWQNSFYVAISASAHAALRCVTACLEDFRGDLAAISIPVLVIHGDQDRLLPYEATSRLLPALLTNARSIIIADGPHAIIWTHADEVNRALLDFIGGLGRLFRRATRHRVLGRRERTRRVERAYLTGSGLGRLRREPQRVRINAVRVNCQHLPIKFLRRGRFLVEPVEVADVLAGFTDGARVVVLPVALVSGDDGMRTEPFDDVECREPLLASLRV